MVISFEQLLEMGREYEKVQPGLMERRIEELTPDDLAVLIYTSGTTGPPKGAMLTHCNLLYICNAMEHFNPVSEKDEFLSFLPLCHIFEQLFTVLANIRYGAVVNFIENTDTVTANMREVSPTVGYAVPRIWEKYYSTVMIKMSDADWIKRQAFKLAMAVGMKQARLKLNHKPIPASLKLAYILAYNAVFRPLKKRLGFDRIDRKSVV